MFDTILRELKKLDETQGGISIPIQVPLDAEGYFDRRCPSAACQAGFKVLFEDWRNKVSGERAFCPICREQAKATEWNTPEQCDYIQQVGVRHIQGIMGEALSQDATEFNRTQRPGFIQVSMSYKPGAPTLVVPIRLPKSCDKNLFATSADAGIHHSEPHFSAQLADAIPLKTRSPKL